MQYFLLDMIQTMDKPVCAVVSHAARGREVIAMGNQILDIYNMGTDQWRNGPTTTLVRCVS